MNVSLTSTQNGVQQNSEGDPTVDSANVLRALQIVQNPLTDNAVRRKASEYLDEIKSNPEALQYGYHLGVDRQQEPLVRHFAFSLLEHIIRHQWHDLDESQGLQLRKCVVDLGQSLSSGANDPPFLRNKIGQLWIELAKRSWALDWFDLDELLVQMWSGNFTCKELVLTVLENLSEDLFVREDSVAVLRGRDLGTALVDIFTSKSEHDGDIKVGNQQVRIRYLDEGWLSRIKSFIDQCLQSGIESPDVKKCLLKALATVRSAFSWVMTTAIINTGLLPTICNCLARQDSDILMAGIEALLGLYGRHRLEDADIEALAYPMCHPDNSRILQELYTWSIVGTDEIESPKYTISKKLSEMISCIADFINQKPPSANTSTDFTFFLGFMVKIAQHQSLIVSIPIVHSWTKMLAQTHWRKSQAVAAHIAPLLEFACQRTVQYDQLPEDTEEPAVIFVYDEIELFPERQGFFTNYRRLCCQIIELICYAHLKEAIPHVIANVDMMLNQLQEEENSFDPATYSRASIAALHADAQFTIVESAFKGFSAWRSAHEEHTTQQEQEIRDSTNNRIRGWAVQLLESRSFKDPLIKQRMIKCAVEISGRVLKEDTAFALKVLEHILTALITNNPDHSAYADAVDDLHMYATSELMRLSVHHSNYFITFYDLIEGQVQQLNGRNDLDEKTRACLTASLFLIVQRNTDLDADLRKARLSSFLQPILHSWQNPEVQTCLSSLEEFTKIQLFDQVAPYMMSINAPNMHDWSQVALDVNGDRLRKDMLSRSQLLPLRLSRTLLSVSTEKISAGSSSHALIRELWTPLLPTLLQAVLQLVNYNHQLHDISKWPNLPVEMRGIAHRILQDRYWQSGITSGSMNAFHQRVKSSKNSVEGFASAVRARIRSNLEHSYSIIHTLARLGDSFFNLQDMPQLLSQSLVSTSVSLSTHHFATLLNMLTKLIDECPPPHRQNFLTYVLSNLLLQIDQKCTTEWQRLESRKESKTQDENLSEEMREDSILRSLTYRVTSLIAPWLDPVVENAKPKKSQVNGTAPQPPPQSMRDFVLSNVEILEPLLFFCTHALSYHDTKTCSNIVRALRGAIAPFATPAAANSTLAAGVREYISHDLLRAAITALHDGHFVEQQKDIASLVAAIWADFGLPAHERAPLTMTPRNVLLSLPGMTEAKVDEAGRKMVGDTNTRHQRAVVLNLLEGLRGVRLSELGKIDMSAQKTRILEKYLQRESMSMQGMEDGPQPVNIEGEGVDLGGVSEMFG